VKLLWRAAVWFETVTVCFEVAVCWGELLSVTVSVTVNDPVAEYVCVVEEPVPFEPSPNDQLKL
jgi:hypothetical protein